MQTGFPDFRSVFVVGKVSGLARGDRTQISGLLRVAEVDR